MGLNFPSYALPDLAQPKNFRVLTYNVERWNVSEEEFSALLNELKPDFAAIQELAPSRWKIPPGWHFKRAATCVVVSRYPISRFETSRREPDVNGLYCVIETPAGPIGFCCVDLLTPRRALQTVLDAEKVFNLTQVDYAQSRIDERWEESKYLSMWLRFFPEPKLVAGDFNLTVDSGIYRELWSDYQNAFSQTEFGFGHTKRTKINIFNYSTRIDHILSTPQLRPVRCWVGPDMGSDHLPLIADFVLD
jgi:endonuclease/exonuclease/phosphatase (EEP) superfamily protein YafD